MNDAHLITTIKQYEQLYNSQHPNYSNLQKRDQSWDEIGLIMKTKGSVCRERWTRIRDNYRKAINLRKIKISKGARPKEIKAPKFNRELSFLIPYLNDREEDNLWSNQSCSDAEENKPLFVPNMLNSSPTDNIVYMPAKSPEGDRDTGSDFTSVSGTPAKRKRSDDVTNTVTHPVESLRASDQIDPLTDFFAVMARTVKTFPIREQIRIKADIFQIVHSTELKLAND